MMIEIERGRALPVFLSSISMLASASALGDPGAQLESIEVTATRTPEPQGEALASVTVLDRATIEARQATSLQELLIGEAGIEIANNGGLGKQSSLFMRGTESDHVLVLVDGIPLSSATVGSTALQYLPVSEIERIEIVRGPRSSLYGSDAVGGVIQIFTRQGSGAPSPELGYSAGSHGYQQVEGGVGGGSKQVSYDVSGAYQTTNGYDSCLGAPYVSPSQPGGGCYTNVPYDDRYRNASVSGRFAYRPADGAQVEVFALRASGASDFHSDYQNREYFVQQVLGATGQWSPVDALRVSVRGGQARDQATDVAVGLAVNPQSPVAPSLFDTVRTSASLQADWRLAAGQTLTAGGDYLLDRVDSNTDYALTSRRDTGAFGEYDAEFGAQHLTLSARHDDNQQFGGKDTGGAAWGYRFAGDLRFSASYATAFKAPTFNELYYPYYGTPTLKPETSHSVELGLDQGTGWGLWSLHAYQTRITDLIETDPNTFTAQNIDRALIRGAEFQAQRRFDGWTAGLTGTWTDPRNQSAAPYEGNLLPRRAEYSGRLELTRQWSAGTAGARVNVSGRRYDDLANTQPLGGYTTIDLLATWQISRALALEGKVANLNGRRYETALYYPQDGRNWLATLRYTPGAAR